MALWLCRLEAEEHPDAASAQRMGIGAWVVEVDLLNEAFASNVPSEQGLPLVLEWHLKRHLPADLELQAAQHWAQWLRTANAVRCQGRPLLLIHGSDVLGQPQHAGQRLKIAFETAAEEPIWLLQRSGEVTQHFDGMCDAVESQVSARASAERWNYEVYLRDAHWRCAPSTWTIPAVRAVAPKDQAFYVNATSDLYNDWLRLSSHWSELQCDGALDAPVLIESWEGHRLWWKKSVDQQPSTSSPVEAPTQKRSWGKSSADHLALLVHGYYLDALAQMLESLPRDGIDLYVSTPLRQLPAVVNLLRQQNWTRVQVFGLPNRGRDIAPFLLDLLPAAMAVGHASFIKLHTKSSPHLSDGEDWGRHLLRSLLNVELIQNLQSRPPQGLLAPAGTVAPITLQLQNNGNHLCHLQRRFAVSGRELLNSRFIAGSMFAGRLCALSPLLVLELERYDFEPELGQTDGTLAHALERWIGAVVAPIEELPGNATAVPGFGFWGSVNSYG